MLGWVVKALVGRGEGTRSSGAKRNGVAVLCVVWCGVARCTAVGGRAGGQGVGDGIDFYVCEKYKMMDINLLATSPCSLPLSLSPSLFLFLSCTIYLSPVSLFLTLTLGLSLSLILRPFSTHSPRVVHEVVTLVYTTARDHTRPCARYTRTRAFHTNDASRPYNLTSLTEEEEEEEKEGEGEAGGWRSLSARRSRFPTPPRGHPWPPRAAANLTQLPSVSPPFLHHPPCHHQPLRLYIERPPRPRSPAEAQSECFVIIPPCTPPPTPRATALAS